MNERFALPGFQLPDAPKERERTVGELNQTLEVVFLQGVPKDQPLRHFDFYFSLDAGTQDSRLLAYSRTGNFVVVRDNPQSGKDYLIRLQPQELTLLPGVYALRVMEHGQEIFKTVVQVRSSPVTYACLLESNLGVA